MKWNEGKKRKWLPRAAAGLLSLSLLLGQLHAAVPAAWAAPAEPGAQVEQPAILTPQQPQPEEESILEPVSWAQEYMDKLVSWGVMRGDIDGNLEPERDITRAEFVAMVNRAYGYDQTGLTPFIDVESTAWYADDISIAYNVGYFEGISPRMAYPDGNLTREQAVILLARNMMMDSSSGEVLGFSDSRDFSDWSRDRVQAAVETGLIGGYPDGTFRPQKNITRGEVAAMLVNAIGVPIQESGDYALGNVYGNATISTSGVSLRNTVIAGDLYLTGGIGLGDVLLENVTVLGKIVASGAGESNRGDSSIVLRNVTADEMIVDSISNQFVTVRAEGDTAVDEVSIRTHGYVEDVTRDGLGLKHIALEGEPGTELQVAGNVKRVTNFTPDSRLVIAQGVAGEVTVDEHATNSMTVVENGARVQDLNLDVATSVSGSGDVTNLTVSAGGSIVTMLPDTVTIRPGITSTVAGELMDHMGAAEASGDPMLLAGYPTVRDVAPTTAQGVFNANKRGTIYWAVSAVSDGSVSESDVISPPSYGGKIVRSGRVTVDSANTEYTNQIAGLTPDGSYYLTAVMVDSRGQHSALKVSAFTTPDNTVPAFANGYPVMSRIDKEAESAQVTAMTNKDCVLYYALLPANSTAPTPQDFKANSLNGNLGFGTADMVKNSTLPINVNRVDLEEQVSYDLYLWLTDYNGANSSKVTKLTFTTADTTPPVIEDMNQTRAQATSVEMTYVLNEPGTLYWAVVKEGDQFLRPLNGVTPSLDNETAKMQVMNGIGALKSGRSNANQADAEIRFTISGLQNQGVYDLYYVAQDRAGNFSERVEKMTIRTLDNTPPTVTQEFTKYNGTETTRPLPNTDIRLVFSENIQGVPSNNQAEYELFRELYQAVEGASGDAQEAAKEELAAALRRHIQLWNVPANGRPTEVYERDERWVDGEPWVIDYRNAKVALEDQKLVITFPTNTESDSESALNLASGGTYHFVVTGIADRAIVPNLMGTTTLPNFTTVFAQIDIGDTQIDSDKTPFYPGTNDHVEFDLTFELMPASTSSTEDGIYYDMLIWSDTVVQFELYGRVTNDRGQVVATDDKGYVIDKNSTTPESNLADGGWKQLGDRSVSVNPTKGQGYAGAGLFGDFLSKDYQRLNSLDESLHYEYAIHITQIDDLTQRDGWSQKVTFQVNIAAGSRQNLNNLGNSLGNTTYWRQAVAAGLNGNGVVQIEEPQNYNRFVQFRDVAEPMFMDGYPKFTPSDSSVDITVMLDRPGTVYYVLAPVLEEEDSNGDIVYSPTVSTLDKNKKLVTPDRVPGSGEPWERYKNDLANNLGQVIREGLGILNSPANQSIFNPANLGTSVINQIRSGNLECGGRVGSDIPRITGLDPNTTYYAYFVLKGNSNALSEVYLYKFRTQKVQLTTLTLTNRSPSVSFRVGLKSDVDYLIVAGSEALNAEVLSQPVGTSGTKNILTSLSDGTFNELATRAQKQAVADLIRGVGGTGAGLNHWTAGSIVGLESTEQIDFTDFMTGDNNTGISEFTVIAVAHNSLSEAGPDNDVFHAVHRIHLLDKDPPYIMSYTTSTTVSQTSGTAYRGTLSIYFSEPIYLYESLRAGDSGFVESDPSTHYRLRPITTAPIGSNPTLTNQVSIMSLIAGDAGIWGATGNNNGAVQNLTLEFGNVKHGQSFSFPNGTEGTPTLSDSNQTTCTGAVIFRFVVTPRVITEPNPADPTQTITRTEYVGNFVLQNPQNWGNPAPPVVN